MQLHKDGSSNVAAQCRYSGIELEIYVGPISVLCILVMKTINCDTQELAGKNAEMIEEVSRVRIDLNAKIERLENDRRSKEDLYSRIASLEKELSG